MTLRAVRDEQNLRKKGIARFNKRPGLEEEARIWTSYQFIVLGLFAQHAEAAGNVTMKF